MVGYNFHNFNQIIKPQTPCCCLCVTDPCESPDPTVRTTVRVIIYDNNEVIMMTLWWISAPQPVVLGQIPAAL